MRHLLSSCRTTLFVAFLCGFGALTARSQTPRSISYQALITRSGAPLQGTHTVKISLYDSVVSGQLLFRDQFSVNAEAGVISVVIGSGLAIPDSLTFERPYFLSISVDGDPELDRTPLTAVPYSLHSSMADQAASLAANVTGVVRGINKLDGQIVIRGAGTTTVNQTKDTITITSSAAGGTGVQGVQNTDGTLAISSPNGPIITVRVADSSIGLQQLRTSAVTTSRLSDRAVTGQKIAQATITTENINASSGTPGTFLMATAASVPVWKAVELATGSVTGVLPVDHGGTGQSGTLTPGGVLYGQSSTAAGITTAGTTGQVLTSGGSQSPTWQTPSYVLPGSLIGFGDASPRSGYTYTGSAEVHEGWSTLQTTGATAVAWPGTAVSGGKMYTFGGYAPSGTLVQVFDPATRTWSTKSNTGFTNRWSPAAVAVGSKVYVLAGGGGGGAGEGHAVCEVYDVNTDSWSSKAAIPNPVSHPCVAEYNNHIYCIGGVNVTGHASNFVQDYNIASNTWTQADTTGFTPRFGASAVATGGKILVIGGAMDGNVASNAVEEYDPQRNSWRTINHTGYTPRFFSGSAVLGGKVYTFSGCLDAQFTKSTICEVYDPVRDYWQSLQSIGMTARTGTAAGAINGTILLFGGTDNYPTTPLRAVSTLEVFDPVKTSLYWFRKN